MIIASEQIQPTKTTCSETNFADLYEQINQDDIGLQLLSKSSEDVRKSLNRKQKSINDFITLLSPAATPFIETMAQLSWRTTRQRFGKTIQLFLPLYLSNTCHNICTYCGFSLNNPVKRITLSQEQLEAELQAIKATGFEHVLLVTGEAPGRVGMPYFRKVLPQVKRTMAHVSMEVQPLDEADYAELIQSGLDAVYVYQETYNRHIYAKHHLRGNKQDFFYRLNTPDRLGRAGINKTGIAALMGLSPKWRVDVVMSAFHLSYLQKKYWRTRYSISLPRLRPCEGGITPAAVISDREMVQLICAWRIVFPEVEISLSTREPAALRDQLVKLGVTSMSAGVSTRPGGYANPDNNQALAQFDIDDMRSASEIARMIRAAQLEAVWKDSEISLNNCR